MASETIAEFPNINNAPPEDIKQEMARQMFRVLEELEIEAQNVSNMTDGMLRRKPFPAKILLAQNDNSLYPDIVRRLPAEISQNDNTYASSPIQRVPPEIFYQVFQLCLPDYRNPIPRPSEHPLLLTHVCGAWRRAALASPRLWTRIHIAFTEDCTSLKESILQGPNYYGGMKKERMEKIICVRYDAVKEWLSRSGCLPLSISLNFTVNRGSTTSLYEGSLSNITLQLFALIKSVSARLESFEFSGPPDVYAILDSMLSIPEMKTLTTLKVCSTNTGQALSLERRQIHQLNAPNLKNVSFAGNVNTFLDVPTSPLIWKQFTDISLHYMGISSDFIDLLLRKCPNLVHFLAVISTFQPVPHGGPIHLPFLLAISIEERILPELMHDVYERIDAPQLKWVNYANYRRTEFTENIPERTIPIIQLLLKCRELKKLTFDGCCYLPSVMRDLYRSVPGITTLVIGKETRPSWSEVVLGRRRTFCRKQNLEDTWNIGALVIREPKDDLMGGSILLPRLDTLEVFSAQGKLSNAILSEFIESRMTKTLPPRNVAGLKKVYVDFSHHFKQVMIRPTILHQAKAAGIKVEVRPERGGERDWLYQMLKRSLPEGNLGLEQLDDYGRTWGQLDVREHTEFINRSSV